MKKTISFLGLMFALATFISLANTQPAIASDFDNTQVVAQLGATNTNTVLNYSTVSVSETKLNRNANATIQNAIMPVTTSPPTALLAKSQPAVAGTYDNEPVNRAKRLTLKHNVVSGEQTNGRGPQDDTALASHGFGLAPSNNCANDVTIQ